MKVRRQRTHEDRPETNEEILYWGKDSHGYVKLRLQFQTRSPDLNGRLRYAGLKGKSITVGVRSPGMALQLIDYIEECIEKFVPGEGADKITEFSTANISPVESSIYNPHGNPPQLSY